MKLIHTADIHLDAPFAYLTFEKREAKRAALRQVLVKIIDTALADQTEAVVIAGDLFNSAEPAPDTTAFVVAQLSRLSNKSEVLIVPGNHDFYRRGGVWDSPAWPDHVHIFKADGWSTAALTGGCLVAGIACHRTGAERSVLKDLRTEGVAVAVMHGAHRLDFFEGRQSYPFSRELAEKLSLDYLALGHYHNYGRVGDSCAYYSGTPEGLCFDEAGSRLVLSVELGSGKAKVEPIKSGRYTYRQAEIDCTAFAAASEIEAAVTDEGGAEELLKIKLTGAPPLDVEIDIETLIMRLADRFFYLDIKDQLDLPLSTDSLVGETTIKAKFLARMQAKLESADDEARRVISLATRLGLAALEGRMRK